MKTAFNLFQTDFNSCISLLVDVSDISIGEEEWKA